MEPERWRRASELFEAAVERPGEERRAFVEREAGGDAEVAAEVARMLAADERTESFLERPAVEVYGLKARAPLAAGSKVGRYEIVSLLGRGGFGEVFEGWDPALRRPVAIKVCTWASPALARRFAREAEIAARLDHPAITRVHDFGLDGGVPFLVQELLPGEDLRQRLEEPPPMPLGEQMGYLCQLAQGLAYAHAQGVIHRDIKPGNLRLLPDGRLKILDFGIARLAGAGSSLTQTGAVLGTAAYMAPEQIRGQAVDARADVYAFGAVAYELLTLEPPFAGDSGPTVLYRILEEPPPSLARRWPQCPPALVAVVERCLAKRPEDRFESFAEVLAELARIEATADLAVVPSLLPARPAQGPAVPAFRRGRAARRRRWAAAGLVAAAALAVWRFGMVGEDGQTAAPALGRLRVVAAPWGELVAIEAAAGEPLPLPEPRHTPLLLTLPPGTYTLRLRHPRVAATQSCRVELAPGGEAECRVVLERVEARRVLEELGGAGG